MTTAEAIKKWGYKTNVLNRLEEICRLAPERFVVDGKINIADTTEPLYVPDKNYKSQGAGYAHLLKACVKRREVIPASLGLSEIDTYAYLEQLVKQGLIVPGDQSKRTTLRYIPTVRGEDWLSWKNKVKRLFEIITPIVHDISINA